MTAALISVMLSRLVKLQIKKAIEHPRERTKLRLMFFRSS